MPATTVHDYAAPADWRPLDDVVRLVADTPHSFEPGRFMYMGRATTKHGVTIHLYKHNLTRRHLPWTMPATPTAIETDGCPAPAGTPPTAT